MYFAFKGYFDKEDAHSKLVRLQTFFIITSFGAKLKNGGELTPDSLWKLKGDGEAEQDKTPSWAETSPEERKNIIAKLKSGK